MSLTGKMTQINLFTAELPPLSRTELKPMGHEAIYCPEGQFDLGCGVGKHRFRLEES